MAAARSAFHLASLPKLAQKARDTRAVARRFRGSFHQKVDSKGRVSIPADFRPVLDAGDPSCADSKRPSFVLVYGLEEQQYLECFTIEAFEDLEDRVEMLQDGSPDRELLESAYISACTTMQVDDEGRIVLPQRHREKMGLDADGRVLFAGKGDRFQIWREDLYKSQVEDRARAYLATKDAGYNPRSALPPSRRKNVPAE